MKPHRQTVTKHATVQRGFEIVERTQYCVDRNDRCVICFGIDYFGFVNFVVHEDNICWKMFITYLCYDEYYSVTLHKLFEMNIFLYFAWNTVQKSIQTQSKAEPFSSRLPFYIYLTIQNSQWCSRTSNQWWNFKFFTNKQIHIGTLKTLQTYYPNK